MLTLTANAQKAIGRFLAGADQPATGVRISVTGGGCSGMQYGLALEAAAQGTDIVIQVDGLKVFVDPASAPMLDGVVVDFIDSMQGSGFKFNNPNATASCGCGNSFTV